MNLSHLARLFTPTSRQRGDRYAAEGRVTITHADDTEIRAAVSGGEAYVTTVRLEGDDLVMACNCPYAVEHGACKHQWALLVVAEQQQRLAPLLSVAKSAYPDVYEPVPQNALPPVKPSAPPQAPLWQRVLENVRQRSHYETPTADQAWHDDRRLVYLIDMAASTSAQGLVIQLATERLNRDGSYAPPKLLRANADQWLSVPDPLDRQIGQMLRGATRASVYVQPHETIAAGFVVGRDAFDTTLRLICETGRCRLRAENEDRPTEPLRWDGGPPWRVSLRIVRDDAADALQLRAVLERDDATMQLNEPAMLHSSGILVANGALARFDTRSGFALVAELRASGPLTFTERELPALLAKLYALPHPPSIALPSGVTVTETRTEPAPVAVLKDSGQSWSRTYTIELQFVYGDVVVSGSIPGGAVFDQRALRVVHRDLSREKRAVQRLLSLGARWEYDVHYRGQQLTIAPARLARLVAPLLAEGWRVTVDGITHRTPSNLSVRVESSGVDWFELRGGVRFGDVEVPLPELLRLGKQASGQIQLPDGSMGVLSDEWRSRLAPLMTAAAMAADGTRFRYSQAAILDALLATRPEVEADKVFARAREELQRFSEIEPADPPDGFCGTLRPYQRAGLGWLHFLRRFGLGGCLADDMGLGKTVQVLALLESRRAEKQGTSLVVVPRSLVFNWREEAAHFAPRLRVLDHTGAQRSRDAIDLSDADVVITTYGTLRSDAAAMADIEFDYVILDEAQAIKNASTASAKAARLLRARHRLALTGTPIENRLEELWSLFEFLNPGMLGASATFKALVKRGANGRASDAEGLTEDASARTLLSRALRPVILRRTKGQVAPELPERVEQTLVIELEGAQRKQYDELLAHYRATLLPQVEKSGATRTRMRILEALLRLRQAALHPALIDKGRHDAPSAKLDALVPMLAEAVEEEHKSIVFSQFTSFLALLRERLDAEKIAYAYLDGATHDRQAVVERFQNDDDCKVFLISLKAGGHGLNLTAAEYVFLLDPWWNPAVEAQAIDRAHRIGQTERVVATRFVAHDTIEEKIIELQRSKRELADAILGEDQGILSRIGAEELALLLAR